MTHFTFLQPTPVQMQQLFAYLGLPDTGDGVGIPYETVLPQLLTAISQVKDQ